MTLEIGTIVKPAANYSGKALRERDYWMIIGKDDFDNNLVGRSSGDGWIDGSFTIVPDDEIIEWTITRRAAERYIRDYPDSYWVKQALALHDAKNPKPKAIEFPEVPFKSNGYFNDLPEGTRLAFKNSLYEVFYTLGPENGSGYRRYTDATSGLELLDQDSRIYLGSLMSLDSIVVSLPNLDHANGDDEIVVRMPVEDARRIGGCDLRPLIDAWDEAHKPECWSIGDKVWTEEQFQTLPVGAKIRFYSFSAYSHEIRMVVTPGNAVWINDYSAGQTREGMGNTHVNEPNRRYWEISHLPPGDWPKPKG